MLSNDRIIALGQSPHIHEQEAIEFVRQTLPDRDPLQIAALVDLVDPGCNRRYDIDLLVIGRHALYVVEIKSHPAATVTGDSVDWTFHFPNGKKSTRENPLRLTNLKARILASLLDRRIKGPRPFVHALVFLSDPGIKLQLSSAGVHNVITRKDLARVFTHGEFPGSTERFTRNVINRPQMQATRAALEDLGIRPSKGALKIDGNLLGDLLVETPSYQDHLGQNESAAGILRRVRTFLVPKQTTQEARDRLRRAAEREVRNLQALSDHRNILRVVGYHAESPLGPCVLFEHHEDALPLDAFLRTKPVSLEDKLSILEQIADALAYCHKKQIVHRALHPGSVLVRRTEDETLEVRLYNFHLAARESESQPTRHLSNLAQAGAELYRAPELFEHPELQHPASDVFSLGAIAYLLLTGRPPGENLIERAKLLAPGHLSLAAARDDLAGDDSVEPRKSLEDVIAYATDINPVARSSEPMGWFALLADAITAPTRVVEKNIHPLDAKREDILDHELLVEGILGSGSTARALRVDKGGTSYALKVSLSPDHDARLSAEAEALRRLESDRIVKLEEELSFDGRPALLMTYAGDNLAHHLATEGPLSLDYARRFGEDLLTAVDQLEHRGVQHRDIKPANMAISRSADKKARHLRLFDFSMAGLPADAISSGTPAYRDRFLLSRGAWDEAADRYAAAVTLHEMLTGTRPRWGKDDFAAATDSEITLDAERFDPGSRDRLVAFFRTALHRDVQQRFASAEKMRTEWTACFSEQVFHAATAKAAGLEKTEAETGEPNLAGIIADSSIENLPLSVRAKNALDRAGALTADDLVRLPDNQLSTMRGIGRKTAREILDLRRALERRFPAIEAAPEHCFFPGYGGADEAIEALILREVLSPAAARTLTDAGLGRLSHVAAAPRDRIHRLLAPFAGASDALAKALTEPASPRADTKQPQTIPDWIALLCPPTRQKRQLYLARARQLLGLDDMDGERITDAAALAKKLGQSRAAVYLAFDRARDKWKKLLGDAPGPIHIAVQSSLEALAGAAPLAEVAAELSRHLPHPTAAASDPAIAAAAARQAGALARIAAETSATLSFGRIHKQPWLALSPEHLQAARALGDRADDLAGKTPLPSPRQVAEALCETVAQTPLEPAADAHIERLVTLAANASEHAAKSARLELYPQNLPAERAMDLVANALSAPNLRPEAIAGIIRARYPQAQIPDDASLRALLEKRSFAWDEQTGTFVRAGADTTHSSTIASVSRRQTRHASRPVPITPGAKDDHRFEQLLLLAMEKRHFRVLQATPALTAQVERELARRLDIEAVSFDSLLLAEMRDTVKNEYGGDPEVLFIADAKGPGTEDWKNLTDTAQKAAARIADRLLAQGAPIALSSLGLCARYQLGDFIQRLFEATEDDRAAVFLINAATGTGDGSAVIRNSAGTLPLPRTAGSQVINVPLAWLENENRGQNRGQAGS